MPDYIIDGAILTDIADAVREKTGTTEPIVPENMAEMFRNVKSYEDGYAAGYNEMKLAVDMSDETYRFNEKVTSYHSNWYNMNLNFTDANGASYKKIATYTSSGKINIQYTPVSGSNIAAYNAANSPMWADEAYRTIHITDGAMTGDAKTFAWLIENGTFNPNSEAIDPAELNRQYAETDIPIAELEVR